MDLEKFERDRVIDPNQLDVAAVTQGDLFFRWAEQAVAAQIELDQAKLKLELVETRLQMECRSNPENFGLAKVTEQGVATAVRAHRDYAEAYKEFLAAKENSLLLGKAVEAMEQRKRMIEVLTTLHGQQYFAGPSVPRDLGACYKEYREGVGTSAASRQQPRRRGESRVRDGA
jgi:hypothetical protein